MRRLPLLLTSIGMALSAFATEPVTVEQLNVVIVQERTLGDSKLASKLSCLLLTERLSSKQLTQLRANLPGEKSRRALTTLADAAVFLDPPWAEIVEKAAPDVGAQKQIVARVVDYVAEASHKLPNFFATRTTKRFEDWPLNYQKKGMVAVRYIPPQLVNTEQTMITYRNGAEVLESSKSKRARPEPMNMGLYATGLFGPVMTTVLVDSSRGSLKWSRWESGDSGDLAVFEFRIPLKASSYELKFCCVPGPVPPSRMLFSRGDSVSRGDCGNSRRRNDPEAFIDGGFGSRGPFFVGRGSGSRIANLEGRPVCGVRARGNWRQVVFVSGSRHRDSAVEVGGLGER